MEVTDFKMDQQEGSEAPSVNANMKARIVTIGFTSDKLMSLLRQRIEKNVTQGKKLQPKGADTLEYTMQGLPDEKGNGKILVNYKSKLVSDVSSQDILDKLPRGSVSEGMEKLRTVESLEKIEYKISPSWWPSVPFMTRRVHISVQ